MMFIKIKKLHEDAQMPEYSSDGAACFDLFAYTVNGARAGGKLVTPEEPVTCSTGIAVEVPPGYVLKIYSRSGHGFKNSARLSNCVGIIDSDYRGEIIVKIATDALWQAGKLREGLYIRPGYKVAQALLLPVPRVQFEEVDELSETARGKNGFGSTGN